MALPKERQITQNLFRKALLTDMRFACKDAEEITTMSRRMERSCYNAMILQYNNENRDCTWANPQFIADYSALAARYTTNIDAGSSIGSKHLADKLLSGEIKPENICSYSSIDINPDASKSDRETIESRMSQQVEVKYTTRYQCKKCFERMTTVGEKQIARADESASDRITCLKCGNKWFKTGT